MKRIFFFIFFLQFVVVYAFCQQNIPFNGFFLFIDDSCKCIITYDTLTLSNGQYVRLYKDTLNKIDNNDLKQGLWVEYNRTSMVYSGVIGAPKSTWKLTKKFSLDDIAITFWGQFKDDLKEGKWQAYFPNGKLWKEVYYSEGKIVGNFIFNYESGSPMMKGKQLNDSLFLITKFSEEGDLINEKEYYNVNEAF